MAAVGFLFREERCMKKNYLDKLPKGGLIGKGYRIWSWVSRMNISMRAAYASYFIVLSVFPALLLILSTLRYTSLQVEDMLSVLEGLLPAAIMDGAEELVYSTYQNASGAVAGLSAATALWSSSRGIYGLLRGLNAVYEVEEGRGYLYTRGISVVYALIFFVLILLTLLLHVFGNSILNLLLTIDNPVVIFLLDVVDLRFFFLLLIQSLFFTLMYMALPNRRNGFLRSLPGGVLASLGWLVFSDIYSVYVENFSRYANIYGSVYAIAISLLWLYCCMSILFYGGALNRLLEDWENVSNL